MYRKKLKKTGRIPLSRNRRVDRSFFRIVHVFKGRRVKIYKVRILRDPDDRRGRDAGFLCEGHKEVYVIHDPPKWPAQKVLIHEALHVLFPGTQERVIERRENFLWKHLSDEQKKYLRLFIPKHFVKREPIHAKKVFAKGK